MPKHNVKILISLVLVAGAVAVLIVTNTSRSGYTTDYYHTPSEFLASSSEYVNTVVRVNGKVVRGSIRQSADSASGGVPAIDFELGDSLSTMQVRYVGTAVPDAFRDGADVVVEGEYMSSGTVNATQLLVKCPSKYEALPEDSHPADAS